MAEEEVEFDEFEKMLWLFRGYLEARGVTEKSIASGISALRRLRKEFGDRLLKEPYYVREEILGNLYKKKRSRMDLWALGHWILFIEMINKGLFEEFRNWLIMQGYTRSTVQTYYYALKRSAELIRRSPYDRKRFTHALNTFYRFLKWYFSGA